MPGPRDVLSVLERGAGSLKQLLGAVPRLLALLDDAEACSTRTDRRIDEQQAADGRG